MDENYDFPRSELAAKAKNISRLIEDIDRLDINRKNMMEELKVLRDVTLFYNERGGEWTRRGGQRGGQQHAGRHERKNIDPWDAEDPWENGQRKEALMNSYKKT